MQTSESFGAILEASEQNILELQRQTGFDRYWRAYFWLLAAVIVTYNSEEVIVRCLDALAEMAPDVTAIVVDNASTRPDGGARPARPGVQV